MVNLQSYPISNQYDLCSPYAMVIPPCMVYNNCRLKVEGKGIIVAEPDKVTAILGVLTENVQLETAQKENAETVSSVINSLIRLGVPKEAIQTQAYNIEPVYDYIDGKQVFREYRVVHNLKVDIKNVGMAGKIIDAAVEAGANTVSGISFTVSDPSIYYKEALNAAISDAIAKANVIGTKLKVNVSPIPVQIIEETYQQGTPYKPVFMQVSGQATPIQPGQIEITALIEAVFSYTCR